MQVGLGSEVLGAGPTREFGGGEMQTSLLLWCTGLAILCMWDLSSQTRDRTHILCSRRQIPNYWTTREVTSKMTLV